MSIGAGQVTRFGIAGQIWRPAGSFAGKTVGVPVVEDETVVGGVGKGKRRRTLHVLPDKRIAYATPEEVREILSFYKEEKTEEIKGRKRINRFKVKAQPVTDIIADLKEKRLDLLKQEEEEVFYVIMEMARLAS